MKKIFILLMLGMFLISFASAKAPAVVTTIFTGDIGLQVEVNIMEIYTLGEARFSIIHLFNTTNGYQISNTTNPNIICEIHLRDNQGFEIMVVEAVPHLDHWDLNGSGGGNNPLGMYAYTIVCQDSDAEVGGYTSGVFEITESGITYPEGIVMVFLMLFSLFVYLFLLWALLRILEDFAKVEGSINTIALGFSAYVSNLALYYYLQNFFPMALMLKISLIGISAFGLTHLFLPLIALVFTWIKTGGAQ